jgi:molybdopterin-guanine dinucleotide biosynthesis protein
LIKECSAAASIRPTVIAVGGFTSEVGKTTLLCDLLNAFPGWEAIKTTRGHYRSCGKDPHACCVSHLLDDEPVIKSGRELTYAPGKDTGRYWEAGASNVHWLIATNEQVLDGTRIALSRVRAEGVFVEGNSFTEFIQPDFFIMVARSGETRIKATARKALGRVSAFFVSGALESSERAQLKNLLTQLKVADSCRNAPVFTPSELPQLVELLRQLNSRIAA